MTDADMGVERQVQKAQGGTIEWMQFTALPHHDSTWGLTTGKDGAIYIAACGECFGGLSVFILRYAPERDELQYLIEVGPAVGFPPDDGHATQSKIHYCLLPGDDGLLYCATHASGPPWGDPTWRPWNSWDDEARCFPGSPIFTYNPKANRIDNFGIGPRKEGSRALALAQKRRKLYGITWPRDHFYVYDLDRREYKDLGRFGDINPQAVFLDREENAYTTDDYGYILRCDAETDELVKLNVKCPHEPYRRGWHNVPYDVVPAPDWSCVYGTDWGYESHLWRYDPYDGPEGRMDDLGRAFGPPDFKTDMVLERWQVRGLVFGSDGKLYYTMLAGWEDPPEKYLLRLDPDTMEREVVGSLSFGGRPPVVASATADYYGNLYFADAGRSPTGMFIYRPDSAESKTKVLGWNDIKPWG